MDGIWKLNGIFKSIRNKRSAVDCCSKIKDHVFEKKIEWEPPFSYVINDIQFYVDNGKFIKNKDNALMFQDYLVYLNDVEKKLTPILDKIIDKKLNKFLKKYGIINTNNDIVMNYMREKLKDGEGDVLSLPDNLDIIKKLDLVPFEEEEPITIEFWLWNKKGNTIVDPVYINYHNENNKYAEIFKFIKEFKFIKL